MEMFSRQVQPRSSPMVKTYGKFTYFFNQLIKLAALKPYPQQSINAVERYIQDFMRHHISAEDFVIGLQHIFGSFQPQLIDFLRTGLIQPSTTAPFASATYDERESATNDSVEFLKLVEPSPRSLPLLIAESPKPPEYASPTYDYSEPSSGNQTNSIDNGTSSANQFVNVELTPRPLQTFESPKHSEFSSPTYDASESCTDIAYKNKVILSPKEPINVEKAESTSQQKIEPSPKPSFAKSTNYGLIKTDELMKHVNNYSNKKIFETITPDAVNLMEEFLSDEFRVMYTNVIYIAKARQSVSSLDSPAYNNAKKQLPALDSNNCSEALQNANSAPKILAENNNRKRSFVETDDDTNENGGKKRCSEALNSNNSTPQSNASYGTFQVTDSDVLHFLFENKRFMNTWIYDNAVYLDLFAGFRKAKSLL